MDIFPVNWDSVPDVMNKEQFFRICHISKSTALHLLKSGKVPCEWSGKKTRCYKIKKEDSGELGRKDIERIGTNIRDWISQVGE